MTRNWLKKHREKRKWSQAKLAEKLGITVSYYCLIENGKRMPKLDMEIASNIASAFCIPVERVIRYESAMRTQKGGETI